MKLRSGLYSALLLTLAIALLAQSFLRHAAELELTQAQQRQQTASERGAVEAYYIGSYDTCMLFGNQAGAYFDDARVICNDLALNMYADGWHLQPPTKGWGGLP